MDQDMTATHSPSAGLHHRLMSHRGVIYAAVSMWLSLMFCGPIPNALALPTADEIMKELHLSDKDQARVRQGQIVDWSPSEGSDRELALGMVFLVKAKPENLFEMYREALVLIEVSVITAHGRITGEGTMADLSGVALQPNTDKEASVI